MEKSAIFSDERKNSNSKWFRAQVLEVVLNSKFTHNRFSSNSLIAYLFKRHEFGRYKFWQLRQCEFFEHLTFSFPTFVSRNFETITNKWRQIPNRLYCYFSWNSITERIIMKQPQLNSQSRNADIPFNTLLLQEFIFVDFVLRNFCFCYL